MWIRRIALCNGLMIYSRLKFILQTPIFLLFDGLVKLHINGVAELTESGTHIQGRLRLAPHRLTLAVASPPPASIPG